MTKITSSRIIPSRTVKTNKIRGTITFKITTRLPKATLIPTHIEKELNKQNK